MSRSVKKGPFVDAHLIKKVEVAVAEKGKKTDQNLVASFNNPARIYRADDCCS